MEHDKCCWRLCGNVREKRMETIDPHNEHSEKRGTKIGFILHKNIVKTWKHFAYKPFKTRRQCLNFTDCTKYWPEKEKKTFSWVIHPRFASLTRHQSKWRVQPLKLPFRGQVNIRSSSGPLLVVSFSAGVYCEALKTYYMPSSNGAM